MKIIRNISSTNPYKCNMVAKGFFGNVKGEVKYVDYGIISLNTKCGFVVLKNNKMVGSSTDFSSACDMLLDELNIIKTICV